MTLPNHLLRLWTARIASKIALCSAMTYDLYQLSKVRGKDGGMNMKLAIADDRKRQVRMNGGKAQRTYEDIFIDSLVAAGSCRQHAPWRAGAWGGQKTVRRAQHVRSRGQMCVGVRNFSTSGRRKQTALALPEPPEITREEYTELVDIYNSPSDLWEKPEHSMQYARKKPGLETASNQHDNPKPNRQHIPLAPRLVLAPGQESKPLYSARVILEAEDVEHKARLRLFRRILHHDLGHISLPKLWDVYQSLRAPRPRYLADADLRRAFRHFSWVEFRPAEGAMQRYFALLEDCLAESIPLSPEEWNSAIAFAGRWVRNITTAEVKGAVETWRRMEAHSIQASHVTFNILFDIAIKAGRFALADTIFAELKERDMLLNRYFRTSMIYYQGLRGDGEGVRQAFRELVEAGEIVDTAVMNCVILSLIRAGEPAAAENVFARMKRLVEQKLGTQALRGWRENKNLGRLLNVSAAKVRREAKEHEKSFFGAFYSAAQRREEVQRLTPIAPDARTYRILMRWHAYTSGDLARIKELLAEMRDQGFKIHGGTYTHLFRGFALHGGNTYSPWSRSALQSFWDEFLTAAAATNAEPSSSSAPQPDEEEEASGAEQAETERPPYFTRALVHAAIRAFYKCAGKRKMGQVWEQVRDRWGEMSETDEVVLMSVVRRLEGEDAMYGE